MNDEGITLAEMVNEFQTTTIFVIQVCNHKVWKKARLHKLVKKRDERQDKSESGIITRSYSYCEKWEASKSMFILYNQRLEEDSVANVRANLRRKRGLQEKPFETCKYWKHLNGHSHKNLVYPNKRSIHPYLRVCMKVRMPDLCMSAK